MTNNNEKSSKLNNSSVVVISNCNNNNSLENGESNKQIGTVKEVSPRDIFFPNYWVICMSTINCHLMNLGQS